jgi:hypothetical protein
VPPPPIQGGARPPLGRRFRFERGKPPIEVVGIAKDAKYRNIREDTPPFVYLPLTQNDVASMTLHVQTGTRPPSCRRCATPPRRSIPGCRSPRSTR